MKFADIEEAFRGDTVTTKARNNYDKISNEREKAIEDFSNNKINEVEFLKALKKAGFGETRSKEILKQALNKKKENDVKKSEAENFNKGKQKWEAEVKARALKKNPYAYRNDVEPGNKGLGLLSKKLGKFI